MTALPSQDERDVLPARESQICAADVTARQAMHPGMQRALMLEDHGRDGVGSLPGMPQHMLEQNVGLIHTVRQNMSGCRIQENTELVRRNPKP